MRAKTIVPAEILPPDVRRMLIEAASLPIPKDDPLARQKAIERATARAKFKYPHLFR